MLNNKCISCFIIIIVGVILFVPGLGNVHLFDWDEINFAESSREMILTENFSQVKINFLPFWEKPPLFFWCQVLSMKVFGINEYASRFPNAIVGIATLISVYIVGNKVFNHKIGLWWVISIAGSFLPHFYFKSGIIDPLFNLFIFGSIFQIYQISVDTENNKLKYSIYAGIFLGLAVMTKGPVAILITGLVTLVYWIIRKKTSPNIIQITVIGFSALFVASLWFGYETYKNGTWFLEQFLTYQVRLFQTEDAGHGQPWFYHPLVILIGCFPASIFALRAFGKSKIGSKDEKNFILIMKILFWAVLIVFSIVKTKIVHYSSLCYLPLTFLSAIAIYQLIESKIFETKWQKFLFILMGILLSLVIVILPLVGIYKSYIIPLIKDPFAVANLQADANWQGYEFIGGLFLLIGILFFIILKNLEKKILVLFIATCITLQFIMYCIIPKIEVYVQGEAINFYKSHANDNSYVAALGFKSFGQYFYSNRQPDYNQNANNEEWLKNGPIDKTVYFITKIDREENIKHPNLIEIGRKNGFIFAKREVKKP